MAVQNSPKIYLAFCPRKTASSHLSSRGQSTYISYIYIYICLKIKYFAHWLTHQLTNHFSSMCSCHFYSTVLFCFPLTKMNYLKVHNHVSTLQNKIFLFFAQMLTWFLCPLLIVCLLVIVLSFDGIVISVINWHSTDWCAITTVQAPPVNQVYIKC